MFIDWRKVFSPTDEELQNISNLIENLQLDEKQYYKELGFNEEECVMINFLDVKDHENSNGISSSVSRRSLLESGIITIEDIHEEIQKYLSSGG